MRALAFIISLLLLAGTVDPTQGWLIALVVVTGLAALRLRFVPWLRVRPAIDLRLGSFVLAVLLLAGAVDTSKEWLIGLTVLTGFAMICPRLISIPIDARDRAWRDWRNGWDRDWEWEWRSDGSEWR
jgi:hypothetical protein